MMRIESVAAQPDRAGRHKVCLEDGSVLRLYPQTVQDFCLYAGLELTEEQLSSLRKAASEMSAKMRAVRIVAASSVSKRDLEHRLVQKGEDPTQAKKAVAWMEELDLIDDSKTAEQIVRRCAAKGYGIARAKQALYEKRIPKEFWEEALADYPDQSDAIAEFLRAKLGAQYTDRDLKRAIDALMRRGHTYSQIRSALQQLSLEAEGLEDY